MQRAPYSLKNNQHDSQIFYKDLDSFTHYVLKMAHPWVGDILKHVQRFIRENELEFLRSKDEYLIEFLALGVYWNTYGARAQQLSKAKQRVLRKLYALRSGRPRLKPYIDAWRGRLMTAWMAKEQDGDLDFRLENFSKLVEWLQASGEFHEEAKRFGNWALFFQAQAGSTVSRYLKTASEFAAWFAQEARKELGVYTRGVDSFLLNQKTFYKNREDVLFTGRCEVEYHLNMVSAEILNRQLLHAFLHSKRHVVLLPTCLRLKPETECKAKQNGLDIECTGCCKACRVNQLTQKCRELGAETRLIPHSSRFTEWLQRYQNDKEIGLVGVACVLNLLTGGYEMKNLGLASQCVFLDYCGCQKHWHETGVPTDLNECQIEHVLSHHKTRHLVSHVAALWE